MGWYKPLKTLDLILNLSKDEAKNFMLFQQPVRLVLDRP